MKEKIFIIRRIKEGYYPVDFTSDFEIILESVLRTTDVVLKEITDDLIPEQMKDIPSKEIVLFLSVLLIKDIIFIDARERLHNLADKSCWLSLEELGIKRNIIKKLNKYNSSLSKDFKDKYNLCDEVNLLGEMASFRRSDIAKIPGIGKKSMELLDGLIYKNWLYWEFDMKSIKKLGKYY